MGVGLAFTGGPVREFPGGIDPDRANSIGPLASGRQAAPDGKADDDRADKQHHEDAEQHLGDARRGLLDTGKTEYAGDDGDQQENGGPFQHRSLLGSATRQAACSALTAYQCEEFHCRSMDVVRLNAAPNPDRPLFYRAFMPCSRAVQKPFTNGSYG